MEIPTQRQYCCHSGGYISFDSHGLLYLSTGDNTNAEETEGYTPVDERPGRALADDQATAANTNDLVIYTNSSQSYIRANGARNLDIMRNGSTVATFNANGIALPSGLGIDFSATSDGSGTTTSELLDDYEEGTFTPSFTGGTSGSGYTRQVGEYTKVGRLVTFTLTIDGDGGLTGTATAIEIGGLPFTSRNVPENGGAQYTYPGNFDTTNDRRFWLVAQNNTTLSYRSATAANINGNLVTNVNSQFVLYGHYFTDS